MTFEGMSDGILVALLRTAILRTVTLRTASYINLLWTSKPTLLVNYISVSAVIAGNENEGGMNIAYLCLRANGS